MFIHYDKYPDKPYLSKQNIKFFKQLAGFEIVPEPKIY